MSSDGSMGELRLSVAMCTYNGARYLPGQLNSFLRQQRQPNELVVCDDGSTDQTLRLLEEFAQSAPFPVRIHANVQNLGYSRNFAQAIALCTGDVIALSDQDDVWHPQKLLRMHQIFLEDPEAGGFFSDGNLIDTASQSLPGSLWGSFDFQVKDRERLMRGDAVRVLLRRNVVTGMAFAFRREWRETLQLLPDHWPHDAWLALMLAAEGRLRACPERLVAYRVHGAQQIGVPIGRAEKIAFLRVRGLGAYLALSRERNLREYNKDAVQFESLMAEAAKNPALAGAWWLPLAARKARHMRRGVTQLQSGRLHRWASALLHWKSYRLYAPTGLAALLRDLLL